jgi:polyhydroxybutyrate depolymerase
MMKKLIIGIGAAIVILLGLFFLSCINNAPQTNYIDGLIVVDGIERTYHLYIPNVYDGKEPVPLLIALHGGGGTGKGMEEETTLEGFDKLAEKENFIVVYSDAVQKSGMMEEMIHIHTPPSTI